MEQDHLTWQTITEKHMPPLGESVIFWRGIYESDGGLAVIGVRVQYGDDEPYIRYRDIEGRWKIMPPGEYRSTRWARIPPPEIAAKKREQDRRRREELNEQKRAG